MINSKFRKHRENICFCMLLLNYFINVLFFLKKIFLISFIFFSGFQIINGFYEYENHVFFIRNVCCCKELKALLEWLCIVTYGNVKKVLYYYVNILCKKTQVNLKQNL